MTFGEKIQKLRKQAGLSQEELAYQLHVSRQAISKWERDNGYPEIEKMIRISKIFHVTLDYLLNEEGTQTPEAAAEQGLYISRETADGFLLYQKRKHLHIALAVGMMVGSLALSFTFSDVSMLLFMLIWIVGIVLLISVRLADNPYRKLWKEPLLFDKTVETELHTAYAEKKNFLQRLNLIGIVFIALGILFFPLLVSAELFFADTIVFAAGLMLAGIGTFLCMYMSGLIRTYRLLIMNGAYHEKRK